METATNTLPTPIVEGKTTLVDNATIIPFDPKAFHQAMIEAALKRITIYPVRSIWASQVMHPCLRFNEYKITRWQDQLPINPELQLIFDKGRDEEKIVLRNLEDAGFEYRQNQRSLEEILKNGASKMRYKISGKLDLELGHPKLTNGVFYPAEIKSMSPFVYDSIDTLEDMLNHRSYYVRMYPGQLMSYLLMMAGQEIGIMILENKVTNMLKFIPVPLDYHIGERILANAETINTVVDAVEKDPEHAEDLLSPRIEYDDKICSRCPFNHICLPNAEFGGVSIELGEEVIAALKRREALEPFVKEYKDVDDDVKDVFKKKGVGKFMVGADFNVGVEERSRAAYKYPDEVQAKYKVADTKYLQVSIKPVKKN
jgi:CRISPR/Cas system-associated exonuclease Cas4 (RecB family)